MSVLLTGVPSGVCGQAVVAEPWFKVSDEGLVVEGPAFDRDGTCSSAT
jgi:hypothetical protein